MAASIESRGDRNESILKIYSHGSDENGSFRDSSDRRLLCNDGDGENSGDLRSLSTEPKISFKEVSSTEDFRRRYRDSSDQEIRLFSPSPAGGSGGGFDGEVLVCSGNASFRRRSSFFKTRTSSRLESPVGLDRRSGRLGMSGVSNNTGNEDDDFYKEDFPEEYNKIEFSKMTLVQLVSLISIIAALVCSLSVPVMKKQTLWDLHLWKWEVMLLVIICGRLFSGWGIRVAVFFIERNFLLRKRVLYFVYGLRKGVQNCLWLGLVLIAWTCLFNKKVEEEIHNRFLPFVTKILVCLLTGTLICLLKTLIVKVLALSFHVTAFFERIQESIFNQFVIETLSMPPLVEHESFREEAEKVQKLKNVGSTTPSDLRASPLVSMSGRILGSGGLEKSRKVVGKSPRFGSGGLEKSPKVVGKSPRFGSGGLEKSPKVVGKSPRFSPGTPKAAENEITIDHLHKLNQNNVSAWNMKRLMNIVRHGTLYTLDERILNLDTEDESLLEIRSECQARKAANKIFHNVAKMGSQYIYVEDLLCFMREDEALKTMHLFGGTTEGKGISKLSLKNWMVNAFRERRALALSLKDTNTAVDELQRFLSFVVGIIVVVVWLLILEIRLKHFLVFFSSQVLLLKFVFGNTCKTLFEAIIFLFVMHPFDVGDRCEVEGVQMVVEEMKILTTVFLRYDNQKIVYPNSTLATLAISNYYRSPDMGDAIDFCIHISTPIDTIAIMKERIKRCVESNNDHWYPNPMVIMKDVDEMNSINMAVWITHRMNHQNIGERWARRALLVEEMVQVFRELDIKYRLLPLDVNVHHVPDSTSHRLPSNWTTRAI